MDLTAGYSDQKFEKPDPILPTVPYRSHQDGGTPGMQIPNGTVMHSSDEDSISRKRQRTLNGLISYPTRCSSASYVENQRSSDHHVVSTSKARDPRIITGHIVQGEQCWTPRSGSRVTALYAELVRELEAQVAELHQILASKDDAAALKEWKIQELEQENQALKRQILNLEEQNDALSHKLPGREEERLHTPESHSVAVNESSTTSFHKTMTGFLETSTSSQLPPPQVFSTLHPSTEPKSSMSEVTASPVLHSKTESVDANLPAEASGTHPDGMLRVTGVSSGFQYWMKMDETGENTIPESCVLWEEPLQETLPDGTPAWASPIEGNGRPKLELVPASGVYITYQQLEDLSHIPPDKPKLMTRRLLDYFFSRETLARSSATGQRIAHNNTTMEKPLRLPDPVVTVIKAYVTRTCGRGCNFNAVINSKCGTSRRAVKKMSIRIDWTEAGGGKHCPRTASISSAPRGQFLNEKALVPSVKGTETLLPQSVPQNS
ncbi:uncharacterized protein LOC134614740 [Pelobates fuscus]|uniref:uncharacterized protein LOC134614740 n=1 Tax=Pelobates fuscus TaxID=191477 RepID=UPI002FE46097